MTQRGFNVSSAVPRSKQSLAQEQKHEIAKLPELRQAQPPLAAGKAKSPRDFDSGNTQLREKCVLKGY